MSGDKGPSTRSSHFQAGQRRTLSSVDAEHFFSRIMTSSGGCSAHRGATTAAVRTDALQGRFSFPPTPPELLLLLLLLDEAARPRSPSWSSLTVQEHWKTSVNSTRSWRSCRPRRSSTNSAFRNAEKLRSVPWALA